MIAMLVTMTSSATSFLRALDQNINRVPTIYEMVSSDLLDFTLYGSDYDLDWETSHETLMVSNEQHSFSLYEIFKWIFTEDFWNLAGTIGFHIQPRKVEL